MTPHGGVDAIKMAAMSRTIGDSVRMLKVLRHSRQVIAVPMGEIGLPAQAASAAGGECAGLCAGGGGHSAGTSAPA